MARYTLPSECTTLTQCNFRELSHLYPLPHRYQHNIVEALTKPNKKVFQDLTHYLLMIIDADKCKTKIPWPVLDSVTEANFRKKICEYFEEINLEHPDADLPATLPSQLVHPVGERASRLMWKLSKFALFLAVTANSGEMAVMHCPQTEPKDPYFESKLKIIQLHTDSLGQSLVDSTFSLSSRLAEADERSSELCTEFLKAEELVKECERDFKECISKAPVNEEMKQALLSVNNSEALNRWRIEVEELTRKVESVLNKLSQHGQLVSKCLGIMQSMTQGVSPVKLNLTNLPLDKLNLTSDDHTVQKAYENLFVENKLVLSSLLHIYNSYLFALDKYIDAAKSEDNASTLSFLRELKTKVKTQEEKVVELQDKIVALKHKTIVSLSDSLQKLSVTTSNEVVDSYILPDTPSLHFTPVDPRSVTNCDLNLTREEESVAAIDCLAKCSLHHSRRTSRYELDPQILVSSWGAEACGQTSLTPLCNENEYKTDVRQAPDMLSSTKSSCQVLRPDKSIDVQNLTQEHLMDVTFMSTKKPRSRVQAASTTQKRNLESVADGTVAKSLVHSKIKSALRAQALVNSLLTNRHEKSTHVKKVLFCEPETNPTVTTGIKEEVVEAVAEEDTQWSASSNTSLLDSFVQPSFTIPKKDNRARALALMREHSVHNPLQVSTATEIPDIEFNISQHFSKLLDGGKENRSELKPLSEVFSFETDSLSSISPITSTFLESSVNLEKINDDATQEKNIDENSTGTSPRDAVNLNNTLSAKRDKSQILSVLKERRIQREQQQKNSYLCKLPDESTGCPPICPKTELVTDIKKGISVQPSPFKSEYSDMDEETSSPSGIYTVKDTKELSPSTEVAVKVKRKSLDHIIQRFRNYQKNKKQEDVHSSFVQ